MPGRLAAAALLILAGVIDAGAAGVPDKTDMEALDALRQAMEAAHRADPELPYDKVIDRLRIRSGTASFSNEPDERDASGLDRFPRKRPDGVSVAEWRALQASRIEGGGENGRASYMLVDLDGDGQRDLIIDTYTGGTGMYSSISALRQSAGRFRVPGAAQAQPPEQPDAAYLYALSGHGGNQAADWIRLHGRVYAAYRDSRYGVDNIYLLRPWHSDGQVPRLVIRYRYTFSVPALQPGGEGQATRLAPELHRALNEAAKSAANLAAIEADKPADGELTPLCPVPADATDEVRDAHSRYGLGHYTFEIVADVPVLVGAECHIGQLRNWFGGYTPGKGLDAQLCVRKPEETERTEDTCYAAWGPRTVVGITADVVPFQAEN